MKIPLTAIAVSESNSALSTDVYAAALTIKVGLTSRSVRRIVSG